MKGDFHVRFCGRFGVKLPRPTRLISKIRSNVFSPNIYQWEGNIKYYYYLEESSAYSRQFFSGGVLFRTKRSWTPSANEWGVILEYEWNRRITVGFTYEYPLDLIGFAFQTAGTFELIAIFRLNTPATKAYDISTNTGLKIPCSFRNNDTFNYLK